MNNKELNEELAKLVEISRRYGKTPGYVIGDGGSAAQKNNGVIFVNDADTPLGDITAIDFIRLNRNKLNDMFIKDYPADKDKRDLAAASDINAAKLYYNDYRRVGVNALMHHLFNHKYTLHLRPPLLTAFTCVSGGENLAKRFIGPDVIWAPASRPGLELVLRCRDLLNDYYRRAGRHANTMLIENRGVFVAGDTPEELDSRVRRVMTAVDAHIDASDENALLTHDTYYVHKLMGDIAKCYRKAVYASFASNKRILKFMANDNGCQSQCPVPEGQSAQCCRPMHITVKDTAKLSELYKAYVVANKRLPRIFCVPNVGAVSVGASEFESRNGMQGFMRFVETFGLA